jgi:Na+/proline symporter
MYICIYMYTIYIIFLNLFSILFSLGLFQTCMVIDYKKKTNNRIFHMIIVIIVLCVCVSCYF